MSIHARSLAIAILLGLFTAAESATALDTDPVLDGDVLVFDGAGFGSIPDSPAGAPTCGNGNAGTPLNITFAAVVPAGNDIAGVKAAITFTHTWAGDITATLIDPSGTRTVVLFGRTGAIAADSCGDNSDLLGPYVFTDGALSAGFWEAATIAGSATAVPADDYRSTNSGGAGAVNPMPATLINPTYVGMTNVQATGTWTLRVVDSGDGDLGTVTAATLYLYVMPTDVIFKDGFDSPE